MKLDYLQFLELEVFTRFGSRLEASMEAKIRRGRALREIFKQDRLSPLPIEFQLAWMVAFNEGMFDNIDIETIPACLERIKAGVENSDLGIGDSRERWLQSVTDWMNLKKAIEPQSTQRTQRNSDG